MKIKSLLLVFLFMTSFVGFSQNVHPNNKNWGPNDTIVVPAVMYEGELIPYRELEEVWVSNLPPRKLEKAKREYQRLRNAVYVTYPMAREAGIIMNEINLQLASQTSRKSRKEVIKSRENDLRIKFTKPLTRLSVYQGKVLMKILNRQTGNNCYEIIKDYKGGLDARLYQTVAFFWGSNLKQDWEPETNSFDRDINNIIKEINFRWYGTEEDR